MDSVWKKTVTLPEFPELEGDIKTDVLIIGGGIAGILCAHFLQERGVDYVLAEGRKICSGITENTTAKITVQHGLIYDKLLKEMGTELAGMYLQANQRALKEYEKLCQGIDCDFEKKASYVYSLDNRRKLEEEAEALHQLGASADITVTSELPFSTVGAVRLDGQAQFHPLKFLAEIASKLRIYENTFVTELLPDAAVTSKGKIHFQRLIVATHFPMDNKHGMYFLKMYQHRSYVMALEHAAQVKGMYVDEAETGMSFRNYGELLLVGGGSHRTGRQGGNWKELRSFAGKYYPLAKERYCFATQDCMTLDKIPYIGRYAKRMPECYVATGFNKWGMTSSMVAAMLLADELTGRESSYAEVFCPSRSMLKPQLFLNCMESTKNLLTISGKRCPHMGCALKWNEAEHSWDCPCHGSRFNEQGTLLDNPANGDLSL